MDFTSSQEDLIIAPASTVLIVGPGSRASEQSPQIHLPRRSVNYHRNVLENIQFGALPSQKARSRHHRKLLEDIRFGSFPSQKERDTAETAVQVPVMIATPEIESSSDGLTDGDMSDDLSRLKLISIKSKKSRTWPLDASSAAQAYSWTTCPSSLGTLSRKSSQGGPCSVIDADGYLIGLKDNALDA